MVAAPEQRIDELAVAPGLVLAELAADFERIHELGLTLDCDPSVVTAVGNPVAPMTPNQMSSKGNENG